MSAAARTVETGNVVVDGIGTFIRRTSGEGPPVVFIHGVPDHSEDWMLFLERLERPAIAFDLPGMGRSERPPADRFDCTVQSYAAFVERLLRRLDVEDYTLVVHDWGIVGVIAALDQPERVQRLCAINTVPITPGYRWHRTARGWRTPVLGELTTYLWTRRTLGLGLRESRADWSRHDPEFVRMLWEQLDRGAFDAILRLYRSAPEEELERLGEGLGTIEAPALIVWGQRDRYIPARFGRDFADALPSAELLEVPDAGHWPWIEEPSVIDRVVAFAEGA
jgi:pimeloyl-ACP methyl ester carboxylesterase